MIITFEFPGKQFLYFLQIERVSHFPVVMEFLRGLNCDALRDLIPFVPYNKREGTHGGVLLLEKLQAEA